MEINKLKQTIRSISEKTKNRELLEKILKSCGMSRTKCGDLMSYRQGSLLTTMFTHLKTSNFPVNFHICFLMLLSLRFI